MKTNDLISCRADYPTDRCKACASWKRGACEQGRENSSAVCIFGYCGFYTPKKTANK